MKFLQSILGSPAAGSIARGGYAIVKNQPAVAPVLAGGSVAAALGMILVGGYGVFDCIRFQTEHGQCDESVKQDGGMFAAGVMMLAGNWGAFNTYNKNLRIEEPRSSSVAPRELVEDFPIAPLFNDSEINEADVASYVFDGDHTQEEAANHFGITRYQVRKMLSKAKNGNRSRNRDRGR